MSSFDCYVIYLAIKAHFSRKTYDYFKYNGHIKASKRSLMKDQTYTSLRNLPRNIVKKN